MKKIYLSCIFILIFIISLGVLFLDAGREKYKEVTYNGNKFLVSIDGKSSNTLPTTDSYYLASYDCDSANTVISWDKENYKLNVSNKNKKSNVVCNLTFKSNPLLSEMPAGSYVAYTGVGGDVGSTTVACKNGGDASSTTADVETEAPNSCLGQNAREDLESATSLTNGYCRSINYKYYVTGWRIAYRDSNNKTMIVSAGSPECNSNTTSTNNETYIKLANTKALKYCNDEFVDGGCSCLDSNSDGYCDSASSDAWAINDTDFYNMTRVINGYGKRLSSGSSNLGSNLGSLGLVLYCYRNWAYKDCGYNNDLIDNGGWYWFASKISSSSNEKLYWNPQARTVGSSTEVVTNGLRPVIALSSSVIVTGGSGTMDDPYTISNNTFLVSDYINTKSNVELKLVGSSNVSTMCISVDTSECTDYESFSSIKFLDLSTFNDGTRTIYVYYKDSSGNIVSSMNKTVVIDTVAPTNSSVSIGNELGYTRTLTLNSTGANYMCFSNTSNDINDCTEWVPYATTYTWKLSIGEGTKTVYAFFKDRADNSVMVSDSITFSLDQLPVGVVYKLDYTGEVVVSSDLGFNFAAGTYKLEVWGAQGGNSGGKGGYSVGTITLVGNETLYFYVGGAGSKGTGGFNGGGSTGSDGGGGGGATDIRINTNSLYARVIVAGGGGGKGPDVCATGAVGGGTTGGGSANQTSCGTQAGGGTQTAGGVVGVYNSINGANAGTFGVGGNAADGYTDGGAGGGGWYGGGAGTSSDWSNGGGGGSGFVLTSSSSLPSGYLLGTTYRLTNASTTDGSKSTIPTIDGNSTETGHAGNGYIKITRLN